MRALLDTHAFLWWVLNDPRLSPKARRLLSDRGNDIFFSVVSGWEIVIKNAIGRLEMPGDPRILIPEQVAENNFEVLPVNLAHALDISALPALHKDPFDRLLVAQSRIEGMPIVTKDRTIPKYNVETIW